MANGFSSFAYSDPFGEEDFAIPGITDTTEDEDTTPEYTNVGGVTGGNRPVLTEEQLAGLQALVKDMPRFGSDYLQGSNTAADSATSSDMMEGDDVMAEYDDYFSAITDYNAKINQYLIDEGIPRFYTDDKGNTFYLNIGDAGEVSTFTDMYYSGEYNPQQKAGNYIQSGAVGEYGTTFDETGVGFFNTTFGKVVTAVALHAMGNVLSTVKIGSSGKTLGELFQDYTGFDIGLEGTSVKLTGEETNSLITKIFGPGGAASTGAAGGGIIPSVLLGGLDGLAGTEEGTAAEILGAISDLLTSSPDVIYNLTEETDDTTDVGEGEEEEEDDTGTNWQKFLPTGTTKPDEDLPLPVELPPLDTSKYDEAIKRYNDTLDYYKKTYGFRGKRLAGYKRAEQLKKQAEIDKQKEITDFNRAKAERQAEIEQARKDASMKQKEYDDLVKKAKAEALRESKQKAEQKIKDAKKAADDREADRQKKLKDATNAIENAANTISNSETYGTVQPPPTTSVEAPEADQEEVIVDLTTPEVEEGFIPEVEPPVIPTETEETDTASTDTAEDAEEAEDSSEGEKSDTSVIEIFTDPNISLGDSGDPLGIGDPTEREGPWQRDPVNPLGWIHVPTGTTFTEMQDGTSTWRNELTGEIVEEFTEPVETREDYDDLTSIPDIGDLSGGAVETGENIEEPTGDPIDTTVEPTDPIITTDPVVDPVDPIVDPVDPIVDPVDPIDSVTDPVDPVTDPVTDPVDPTDPATGDEDEDEGAGDDGVSTGTGDSGDSSTGSGDDGDGTGSGDEGDGTGDGRGDGLGIGLGLGLGALGLLRPGNVTKSVFEGYQYKPSFQSPELLEYKLMDSGVPVNYYLQGLFRNVA